MRGRPPLPTTPVSPVGKQGRKPKGHWGTLSAQNLEMHYFIRSNAQLLPTLLGKLPILSSVVDMKMRAEMPLAGSRQAAAIAESTPSENEEPAGGMFLVRRTLFSLVCGTTSACVGRGDKKIESGRVPMEPACDVPCISETLPA